MAENLEKKSSQNLSSQNDDFLDWNDYDEEYEEDDKNDFQNEPSNTETKTTNQKDSDEMEEDIYSDTYSRSKTNRDYTYSSNTYRGKIITPIIIEVDLIIKDIISKQGHLTKDMILIIIVAQIIIKISIVMIFTIIIKITPSITRIIIMNTKRSIKL